jgi:hypothetical protein
MSEDHAMSQLTREHTPRAIAAGMWIGLWAGEIITAGEYWLVRGASFGLSTLRAFLRRPLLYAATAFVSAGGACVYAIVFHNQALAQTRSAQLDAAAIVNGAEIYRLEHGHWPTRPEDLLHDYLRELHSDPWGNPYALYQGVGGAAVVSAGPDGKLGTGDDILIVSGRPNPAFSVERTEPPESIAHERGIK